MRGGWVDLRAGIFGTMFICTWCVKVQEKKNLFFLLYLRKDIIFFHLLLGTYFEIKLEVGGKKMFIENIFGDNKKVR